MPTVLFLRSGLFQAVAAGTPGVYHVPFEQEQILDYRDALATKIGEAQPRCYVVVAVGLERVLCEEVTGEV